ncbi:MAG: dockerin type I repeat-containing protein [Planctomycetota bacterium]
MSASIRLVCLSVLLLLTAPLAAQNLIANGDFSNTTGTPWLFGDDSMNGSVTFAAMDAVVTGGDDQSGLTTFTWIEQVFSLAPGATGTLSFDWSYASTDAPGYDLAFFDVIDLTTNLSALGGITILSLMNGESGSVLTTFNGTGNYVLALGAYSDDNLSGAGVATFDNVVLTGPGGGNPLPEFLRGDVNDDGGLSIPDAVVLLSFLFPNGAPTTLDCEDAGDANDDGSVNLSDAVLILNALFGMPATPLPGPAVCGPDPTDTDTLDCVTFASCP